MRALHELALRRLFEAERQRVDAFMDEKWTPTFLKNYVGTTDIVSTIAARSTISRERERDIAVALESYITEPAERPQAAHAVIEAVERDRRTEPEAIRRELDRFVPDDRLTDATNHIVALLGTDDPARELIEWSRQAEIQIRTNRKALHAPIDEAEALTQVEIAAAYDQLVAAQGALTARMQAAAKLKQLQDDALRGLKADKRFESVKQRALGIGVGVGKALTQIEKLDQSSLLAGTPMAKILRDALAPASAESTHSTSADSVAHR